MNREAHDAEQLNAALDAVAGGATPEQASAGLPAEVQRLTEMGDWFVRAGAEAGARPRPSFVLGLEDQLRTDLRLQPTGNGDGPPAQDGSGPGGDGAAAPYPLAFLRQARVLGLVLLSLAGFFFLTQRAVPGDTLYGAKRLMERTAETLAPSQSMRANISLDRGWRRLEETEALLGGESDRALLEQALTDLVDDYRSALEYAAAAQDDRVSFRAATEVEATRDRIGLWAAAASEDDSSLLAEAREALEDVRLRLGVSTEQPEVPGAYDETPTASAAAPNEPVETAGATATAALEATVTQGAGQPVGTGTEIATASSTPSPTSSTTPTATAFRTPVLASSTPTATATATKTLVPPPDPTDKPRSTRVPHTPPPSNPPTLTPKPERTTDPWETKVPSPGTPTPDHGNPGEPTPTEKVEPPIEPGGEG